MYSNLVESASSIQSLPHKIIINTLPLNRFRQKPAISSLIGLHPYSRLSHSVATETYDPPIVFTYFQSVHNRSLGFGLFMNLKFFFVFFQTRFHYAEGTSFINKSLITHYTKGTFFSEFLSVKKFRIFFILYLFDTFHLSFTYLFTIDYLKIFSFRSGSPLRRSLVLSFNSC